MTQPSQMRIAFIGNQDNNSFRLCKWARDMGYNVNLYMLPNEVEARSKPENIDPTLTGNYPDWLHLPPMKKGGILLRKVRSYIEQAEAQADLIVTSGLSGILAGSFIAKKPLVHWSLGSEVTTTPWKLPAGFPFSVKACASVLYMRPARKTLRNAKAIISCFQPTHKQLNKHDLDAKLHIIGFPEDVVGNIAKADNPNKTQLDARYKDYKRVFLWLSRTVLDPSHTAYKGGDIFVQSFKNILDEDPNVKAVIGEHGRDIAQLKQMVAELGIEEKIEWVPHMPYHRLQNYLAIDNAVVMGSMSKHAGILAGMGRETMSLGAYLIQYDEPILNQIIYNCDEMPIQNAYDVASCTEEMGKALDDQFYADKKKANKEWSLENLHYESMLKQAIALFSKIKYMHDLGA